MEKCICDIFVERLDGKIYPIPGAYASIPILRKAGLSAEIHDSFLQIPNSFMHSYLNQRYADKKGKSWVAVFILGWFENFSLDIQIWFQAINTKIELIKNNHPDTRFAVICTLSESKDYFSNADVILDQNYDSLLKLAELYYDNNLPLVYSHRRVPEYIPANRFNWRSRNLMIDMPDTYCAVGLCANCPSNPESCIPQKNLGQSDLKSNITDLAHELKKNALPKNLALTGNPLTMSDRKFNLISDLLKSTLAGGETELYLEFNLAYLSQYKQAMSFFKIHRIGGIRLAIQGTTVKGMLALGLPVFDIVRTLEELRNSVGNGTYIMVNIMIGLPGDSFESIEKLAELIQLLADQISINLFPINRYSPLTKHQDYSISSLDINPWRGCEWKLPNFSMLDALKICENHHQRFSNDAAYRNYRNFEDVLFSSNETFSSEQIRKDLSYANTFSDGASRLEKMLSVRRKELFSEYLKEYNNVSH